jgi:hypothetical protein
VRGAWSVCRSAAVPTASNLEPVDNAAIYHGPLEEFVARRTALVRTLRSSDADAAEAMGKMRKPSVSAWAIDQLAVEKPDLVAELLAAGADAREAQQAVAGGAASGDDLLVASGRVREAVEGAVRAATTVLERFGHATSEDTARRIRTTLQAAAAGGAAERLALWRGMLDRDLTPTGFGAPDGLEDDAPELAKVLAPLRRRTSRSAGRSAPGRAQQVSDVAARRAAERAQAERDKAAARARAIANTKRQHAERLAAEARAEEEEAQTAEQAAEAAENAAR